MPIYEYLCNACGIEQEHLQKMSDAHITTCPDCGSSDYIKLISASGFQLKGKGWYATDFKNSKKQQSESKPKTKVGKTDKTIATPAAAATTTNKNSNSVAD
tara:strand:+ start:211 stop:513 length:303 start_codon:yes stop_codon:yes gene_type:complete